MSGPYGNAVIIKLSPTTISKGDSLDDTSTSSGNTYLSNATITFAVPAQETKVISLALSGQYAIADARGHIIGAVNNSNRGLLSLTSGQGALGLFDRITISRAATAIDSLNQVNRTIRQTSLLEHSKDDLLMFTNGILVSPYFDDSSVDVSQLTPGFTIDNTPTSGHPFLKEFYLAPPFPFLNAGKSLNLASLGGFTLTLVVADVLSACTQFLPVAQVPLTAGHIGAPNPLLACDRTTEGYAEPDVCQLVILNPELWLVMQPLDPADLSEAASISYPYQSLNTLTLQMGTSLLQRINYLLQNSIIDTFTLMVNYKPTLLNLAFGKYLASSMSIQNLSLLFNGRVQLFNYDTTGLPLAVQLFPHIPNSLVLAASKPGDSQINFEALANANFIPSKIAAEGTGKVFIDTQIGILLQLKPITPSQASFPFFPPVWKSKLFYTLDDSAANHVLYSENPRNSISAGPDWKARFCLLQFKDAFQTSARYISFVNDNSKLSSLRDSSLPAFNTPSCQFIGALEPDQNFNTIIITRNYYTLTITPSASLITAEASVPDVLPDYLRFNQLANQSPISYMRQEIIPLIVVPNPPPGVITLRLIPPLSGFFSTGYLQLKFVLKCREPPCGYGWIQLFGPNCHYLKRGGYDSPSMYPTLSSTRVYKPFLAKSASWANANSQTIYGSPLMAAGYGLDVAGSTNLDEYRSPITQCRAFVPFDCNQGLFNKIGLVNPYSLLRSIRLEFPTGVSALFDNLAENFYLKTYGKPDVFVSASDTVYRNNRFVKSFTSNTLIDKFDRQRHHAYRNELSLFPFHFPDSVYPNMSDLASYDHATLILKVKAECLNFLAEAPFVNSKLYIDFNIDKRNVNLGFVSGGLGSGLVEGDITNYLLGPSPPQFPDGEEIRMLGYPSNYDFDWTLGPDPSFLVNLVYYPPSVQERAMDTFNTTGITAAFSDFERHDRMAVSRSLMNFEGPLMSSFYDHINSNTLLSIGGRNIRSARVIHRYLRQDLNNQFTTRLDDEVPTSLQFFRNRADTGLTTYQSSHFYPYAPKESVQIPKKNMREVLAASWNPTALKTLKGPTLVFGQRLFIPSYIAPHVGPLCCSFPYAITPRTDINSYSQNPGVSTFQVTADGVPMFGDILVGSSLVNSIMYSFNNNGSTLYGLPEQLQYGVPRSIEYYPKCPTFDCVSYERTVAGTSQVGPALQGAGSFPLTLARSKQPFNPFNHTWDMRGAPATIIGRVPDGTFSFKSGRIGRSYHPWHYGKTLLPYNFVTEVSFPDDFLNTQLFSLPSLNCPQKLGPYSNWISGYTLSNFDNSVATASADTSTFNFLKLNVSMPAALALFAPEVMTDASYLCRTYFFNWSYSLTYRRTSAELKQHYPEGYSLNA